MTMPKEKTELKSEERSKDVIHIVHRLDDVAEEKLCPAKLNLGLMRMSRGRCWSLLVLRAYWLIIVLLVIYRELDLAGAFSR